MSLKALIELANNGIKIDLNDPEVKKRNEEFYKRVSDWDKEVEARLRAKILTAEQLNKRITL